jgi:hypothetical protein
VDIAWSESCGEAVAFGVEHEERVIADGLEVPIVRGLLLRPVDRALGTVDVENHPAGGRAGRRTLNEFRVHAGQSLVVPLLR